MVADSSSTRSHFHEEASLELAALRTPSVLVRETLAGIVTALALIPEVIAFSFISGVDPKVALVASIALGLTMSVLGGRPAMVTAAAGSVALVIGPMVKLHGTGYLLPTIILAGLVQIVFGAAKLSRLMRFVPRSVMIGFINALGILIFWAQVPHVLHKSPVVYAIFVCTIAIILILPRFTKAVPAALVAIVAATAFVMISGSSVPNVGNEGAMTPGWPGITPFLVPLNWQTFQIIWPTALSVAFVGLLETLLTAKLVDEITDTRSHKSRESWALGVANIIAGFFGGIAGCAMIGQTIVNVQIGGARTRISTAAAALTLLLLVTALSGVMAQIPMVTLAAVMMIVAVTTFKWDSITPETLRRMPASATAIMLVTVVTTVLTVNLALGVVAGTMLAILLFARRLAHVVRADRTLSADGQSVSYLIHGPLFFGSSNDLFERFAYAADPHKVNIDLGHSQIWDTSSVAVLDSIETKYRTNGATVTFTGLDERSFAFHRKLTGHL